MQIRVWRNLWKLNLSFGISPGIKPFQCDRCGKKFTRAYSLKMHRLKHEGKRCFRCQICSATFTSFGEYKHHMRVSRHIIRKPRIYECKTCGAMFTNSGNLIVHLRSLNHEASELANYFQSRWGVRGRRPPPPYILLRSHLGHKMTSVSNAWGSLNQIVYDFGCAHVFFFSNECNWHELSDHMDLACSNCQDWLKEELNISGHVPFFSAWKARSQIPLKLLKAGLRPLQWKL